jgi:hydrogenase nickel incorporation protein HypB
VSEFPSKRGQKDMDAYKILEIKKSVFEDNDRQADLLREELKKDKVFLLNLMSSPGSGKTTTVLRTIDSLKNEMRIGVLEADIDSDVDAYAVAQTSTKVIQLHTGGMCHLDAGMTKQGLAGLGTEGIDFVILENVGNLVCPAEFDTGASKNAMILSIPEGDDKPLKYPLMFTIADVLLINKIDAMDFFDFDIDAVKERVIKLNPDIKIISISAKTGEGIEEWVSWIREEVKDWNR